MPSLTASDSATAASISRSHSLSSPIERLLRLADPTRSMPVVDDGDLGMDVDVLARLGHRAKDPEPPVGVALANHLQQPGPGRAHHFIVEPACPRSAD